MTKIYEINSKKYGKIEVLLDDEDYDKVKATGYSLAVSYDKTIKGFYIQFTKKPKNSNTRKLSRFITNCPKGLVVDHINRNPLDNRKCNLKVCTQEENNRNRKVRCTCKTGYPGIHIDKHTGKFITRIIYNRHRYYIGKYNTLEEAVEKQKERREQLALQL